MRSRKKPVIIAIMVIMVLALGSITAYEIDRRNCLCYKAKHSPGATFPMEGEVLAMIDDMQLNPETMKFTNVTCRHGKSLWLRIWGTDSYQVTQRGQN